MRRKVAHFKFMLDLTTKKNLKNFSNRKKIFLFEYYKGFF